MNEYMDYTYFRGELFTTLARPSRLTTGLMFTVHLSQPRIIPRVGGLRCKSAMESPKILIYSPLECSVRLSGNLSPRLVMRERLYGTSS